LGHELIDIIDSYFESLPTRTVQLPLEQRSFEPLHDPLPETGVLHTHTDTDSLARFFRETANELIDKGFHVLLLTTSGSLNPTPTYVGVLAEALVAALNPQLATMARSQLASKIEAETVRWIGERFGWGQPFDGTLYQRR